MRARLRLLDARFHDTFEFRWVCKTREVIWVRAHLSAIRSKRERPLGVRGIAYDVSATKELERARVESLRRHDQLLAMLAHELRAPVGAILGWASLLLEQAAERPELRQGLDAILRGCRLQSRLIDDAMDLTHGSLGKLEMTREEVSLTAVLRAAVVAALPAAREKQVALTLTVGEDSPAVLGDERRLVQVMSNLLANAVRYTPPAGRVNVTVEVSGTDVEVTVADTGAGIAAADLERVFEPFFRAAGTSRLANGFGLGLFIAREIVEAHGGTIRAESLGRGRGARFVVRLPRMATLGAPERSREEPPAETPRLTADPLATSLTLGA
jgi:signal transduction histidine kinase